MSSLVHHGPRFGRPAAPKVRRHLVVGSAFGHQRVALVAAIIVTCLVAGAIFLFASFATIDTGGRVPHPVPLPAPTGQSLDGS